MDHVNISSILYYAIALRILIVFGAVWSTVMKCDDKHYKFYEHLPTEMIVCTVAVAIALLWPAYVFVMLIGVTLNGDTTGLKFLLFKRLKEIRSLTMREFG